MKTLRNLFLDQLADIYDAEKRITSALPKLMEATTCNQLREGLRAHLAETEGHVTKVERVFACFDEKAKSKKCKAIVGLLDEGDSMVSDNKKTPAINAAIIAAAQKVEHYEMATYGCLREWAKLLGNPEAAALLESILEEEKAADEKLNGLAPAKNAEAMGDEDVGNGESLEAGRRLGARTVFSKE